MGGCHNAPIFDPVPPAGVLSAFQWCYSRTLVPVILICAPDPLTDELHDTLLWRDGIERHVASSFAEALSKAVAVRPDLAVVDRDLPEARRLVEDLRTVGKFSIAIVARGDFEPDEVALLEAGANAILRLPAGPGWDDRVARLMHVARRKSVRAPVSVEFEGRSGAVDRIFGRLVNLSVSGMLIECDAALDVGTDIDVSFQLPRGLTPIVGTGRIVRQAERGRFGVEFYDLLEDGREHVRMFVEGGEERRA